MSFSVGDVAVSKSGTRVEVLEFYDDSPDTFGGADLKTGDVSAGWERSKFTKEIKLRCYRNSGPEFYAVGAVYRGLKRRALSEAAAIERLRRRAKMTAHLARAVVEMWLRDPLRDLNIS